MIPVNRYHLRVDVWWWHKSKLNVPGISAKKFNLLLKVAKLVLVLTWINADVGKSVVQKNKTFDHSPLKLGDSLSGILAMKMMYPERQSSCLSWRAFPKLLKLGKKQ